MIVQFNNSKSLGESVLSIAHERCNPAAAPVFIQMF